MNAQGPVMVLFMGGTEDHAETSFQKFLPGSVHIITSDKYAEKYEGLLDKWSSGYGFRRGVVNFVDDLFEPSGVNSLVGAFYGALFDERENGPERENQPGLAVGITGGTMHMAVTGAYLAQLMGGFVFYVLRPEEGQPVVPNRDVIHFPVADTARIALGTHVRDIHYLMSKRNGTVEELLDPEENGISEYWFDTLLRGGLLGMNEDGWYLTVHGGDAFSYVANSAVWQNYHSMVDFFYNKDRQNERGGGSEDKMWG